MFGKTVAVNPVWGLIKHSQTNLDLLHFTGYKFYN